MCCVVLASEISSFLFFDRSPKVFPGLLSPTDNNVFAPMKAKSATCLSVDVSKSPISCVMGPHTNRPQVPIKEPEIDPRPKDQFRAEIKVKVVDFHKKIEMSCLGFRVCPFC